MSLGVRQKPLMIRKAVIVSIIHLFWNSDVPRRNQGSAAECGDSLLAAEAFGTAPIVA